MIRYSFVIISTRRPPRSTRTETRVPYTTRFLSRGRCPVVDGVGQTLVADDDEQVEIRTRPLRRVLLVDPVAARIGAIEDDLEDAALLLPVLGRQSRRIAEFLEQDRSEEHTSDSSH